MKLIFAGTRGYIQARTPRHDRHSALEVSYYGKRVRIDCGEDWLDQARSIAASAIVLTHAHPDHTGGLKNGTSCPVYATSETWDAIDGYPIETRHTLRPRDPFVIEALQFEAFDVEHSTRAPAVGYRITAGRVSVFYVPDLVYIVKRQQALQGARIYIGDGATMKRSFVRKPGEKLIGHTPVRTQLTWCRKEGVPRAIITHCGSEIVEGDERTLGAELRKMAAERNIKAEFAYDGLEVVLR